MRLFPAVSLAPIVLLGTAAAAEPDTIQGSEGLTLRRWASEPLFTNPVALDVAPDGSVYVTETVRRKAADLDIRQFREWVPTDLSLTSVDEKRAFYRRELVPENSAKYKKIGDQNQDGAVDWKDLTVLSDRIYRVADTDGDGVADASAVFAEGFDSEVTGIAGGVLYHEGSVYATVAPDFWKLTDTTGDGQADQRESLATGFAVHVAYAGHNMHGPTLGPDGRIYWSIADKGMNVTSDEGHQFFYPDQGAVMRCEPDGSGFEVYAHGLRNTQELAFDSRGNLFAVDNDGDMGGEKERYLYVTEGSDTGWRTNWQYRGKDYNPWMEEALSVPAHDGQPAHITPPIARAGDGPAGFAYNPGTALSEAFRDHFFVTWFPGKKVSALRMVEDGAGFRVEDERLVAQGHLFVGINFGPGGALYLTDWSANGYELNEKGGIWTMDVAEDARHPLRDEVAGLLQQDQSDWSASRLVDLLDHADQRVRLRAQFALARRGEVPALVAVAGDRAQSELARIHALWGLAQMERQGYGKVPEAVLSAALASMDDEICSQAAKVAGDLPRLAPTMAGPLISLLSRESERVVFFAAIALGRLGEADAFPDLVALLESKGGDPFIRHAGVTGLAGAAGPALLATLVSHGSADVRTAAVLALRRLRSPEVAVFLADHDSGVVVEAARAIHDDWSIPDALPALANLRGNLLSDEAIGRRVVSANLRLRELERASRTLAIASSGEVAEAVRVAALDALAQWPQPDLLDMVEGRHRPLDPVAKTEVANVVGPGLAALLVSESKSVAAAAAAATRALGAGVTADQMIAWVEDTNRPVGDRVSALDGVAATGDDGPISRALAAADSSGDPELRAAALAVRAGGRPDEFDREIARILSGGSLIEKQAAFRLLPGSGSNNAEEIISTALEQLADGEVEAGLQLDVLESGRALGSDEVAAMIRDYEAGKDPTDLVGYYAESLEGGDTSRGADIFANNIAAQCTLCHQIAPGGSQVGPDLSTAGARLDRRALLESLVAPGAVVADGYGFTTLTLDDGRVVAGALAGEREGTVTIGTPDGKMVEVPRSEIVSQTPPVSTMPPMGAILKPSELRDLIAYLASLK